MGWLALKYAQIIPGGSKKSLMRTGGTGGPTGTEVFSQLEVGPAAVASPLVVVIDVVVEHLLLVVVGVVVVVPLPLLQTVGLLGQEVVQRLKRIFFTFE